MENISLEEQKKLAGEIHEHSKKGIDAFKEGQAIHKAYMDAPDAQNLTDEVDAFLEKDCEGTAELHKVTELQKILIEKQRVSIAETTRSLRTKSDKA